ncbi:C-type lectin 37Db [Bactrocera dorsalis]|uniref:C-type lectin 37Db n=1 Tax=Bactrocera dorsalis TaxID=27457 RepID=A0A6I9UUN2_BACDO|nr:C-type lectin 37Db [Bactrocera dorsalis]
MQLANLFLLIFVIQIYNLEADDPEYETSSFNRDGIVFSVGEMNWFAAYGFCTQLGMKLLTLQSSVDNEVFKKIAEHYKLQEKYYWLAANRLEDDVTFRWGLRGPPLSFGNWISGQPDNTEEVERCVRAEENHEWDDEDCFTKHFVICHY